jgi:hypothetical protein
VNTVLAVCFPATDIGFGERVRSAIAADHWDLTSPEGLALMESVLRQRYPLATVRRESRTLEGRRAPTIVVDVYRDGPADRPDGSTPWAAALFERSGAASYGSALGIVGDESVAIQGSLPMPMPA